MSLSADERKVLLAAAGAELVTAGLATVAAEGDDRILRPA